MHDPLWTHTAELPELQPLQDDASCEVCVVGAGIAGVATAYRLARKGMDVLLLERGQLASGETSHTTAHLASAQDDGLVRIEDLHGREGARAAVSSHAAAVDWIEAVAADEGIDCDFRRVPGYLFLGPDDEEETLTRELEASRRAGLEVEDLPRAPLPSFDTGRCLAFARQARFHPLRFVAGLARAFERHGGRIHGETRVTGVAGARSHGPRRVRTAAGHTVSAGHVVLATNSPAGHYLVTLRMAPQRTYVVALRLEGEVPDALFWDTADPYHYVRVAEDADGPLLVVGGEDHRAGAADDAPARHARLEAWARERFPVGEAAYAWSGLVFEPADAMAFIGEAETESRVWVITGDSGQGLTHGVIGALLVGDLVLGRENPWERLYSPSRVRLAALGETVKDAAEAALGFVDWLLPGDVASEDEVPPGRGAVVRRGLELLAVYRDGEGTVHRRSAVCTHAGCIVRWSTAAGGWTCPCHGSRFAPKGELLNGPATEGLEER